MDTVQMCLILHVLFGILWKVHAVARTGPYHGYLTQYYYSRQDINVTDSMVLELTNRLLSETPPKKYTTCNVIISTSPGYRLLVHFMALQISDANNDLDRLHIYDFNQKGEKVRLTPPQGLYGLFDRYYQGRTGGIDDYMSSGNKMKIDYQGKPTLAYDGFKILITAFRDVRGDCGRNHVKCRERDICIPANTWCDGYNNCGKSDRTDENDCEYDIAGQWAPIDGPVTAVIAASTACTIFLLTIAVIMFLLVRINKRDKAQSSQNYSVEYRKRKHKGKRRKSCDQREHLTRLHAPPSYDVVVGANDDEPPPYRSVAGDSSDTEDSEDNVTDMEQTPTETSKQFEKTLSEKDDHTVNENLQTHPSPHVEDATVNVISAIVTCDIDGNHQTLNTNLNNPTDSANSDHFQELTNLHLCATGPSSNDSPATGVRKAIIKGARNMDDIDEIEVIESSVNHKNKPTESPVTNHSSKDRKSLLGNGHTTQTNGHINHKLNGHSKRYKRSPSQLESIDFIDNV